jgi:hypothetical protein
MKTLLHIGCGRRRFKGFINTDKNEMDISKPWPYEDGSVDGIVSMAVFQCLSWKDLVMAFSESHRVLKKGGVMRMGVHLVETNYPDLYLYGENINLFSLDLLRNILVDRIGYSDISLYGSKESQVQEFSQVDNRQHKGISYIEVEK